MSLVVVKYGYNAAAGNNDDVIANDGAAYFASAASQVDVSSSSANDAVGSSGCNFLSISGLDANGDPIGEIIAMNGVSTVTSILSYWRVQRAFVLECGATGTNAGNITIEDATGTMAYIAAGEGQTQQCVYTVPRGGTGYITGFNTQITSRTDVTAVGVIYTRENGKGWRNRHTFTTGSRFEHHPQTSVMAIKVGALGDIKVTMVDVNATVPVQARMRIDVYGLGEDVRYRRGEEV